MVQLVADFDVVGAPPAALEERDVLVELVVLAGIELRITLIVGSGGRAASHLQAGREGSAPSRTGAIDRRGNGFVIAQRYELSRIRGVSAQATGHIINVYASGWPAEVMIVSEKVA